MNTPNSTNDSLTAPKRDALKKTNAETGSLTMGLAGLVLGLAGYAVFAWVIALGTTGANATSTFDSPFWLIGLGLLIPISSMIFGFKSWTPPADLLGKVLMAIWFLIIAVPVVIILLIGLFLSYVAQVGFPC